MEKWTESDRNTFIHDALESKELKGQKGVYHYNVYPKLSGSMDVDDTSKSKMTEALAHTIFEKDPRYRLISLRFYDLLIQKIKTSTFVNVHFMINFYIILKGSNAYRMILGDSFQEDFPYSDMDIVIYINPYIPDDMFESLRTSLNSILLQVISQYKRVFDDMFFYNKSTPEWFLDQETIQGFKQDLIETFQSISTEDDMYLTPFENDSVRNSCSKYSFVLRNSNAIENSVVRIEVPHYEKCERIPLRKTPLLASYNSSLNFQRENKINAYMKGEFDLYRLKFTGMHIHTDIENQDAKETKVSLDFIDVSIAHREDAELIDFWTHGRCVQLYDKNTNIWLTVPDINTCVQDLYKMLFVYECPEHKREKRTRRYNILRNICVNSYM